MQNVRDLESLFGELIELRSATEREQFVDDVKCRDKKLAAELRRLLDAHENASSFMENNDGTTLDFQQLTGSSIGPYKLRERLGTGGMGIVWAAEQKSPIKRKVALKLIKPGMDTEQVISRFEAEREALSRMNHPNIATVLDAGTTEQGLPYFVMELICGIPVTEYCDANRFSIRQRIQLFTKICHAVQHAHQKGIIHRDIKPSNVLVSEQDGEPIPKVIDFGVAKALHQPLTDRSLYTGVFQALGTLQYMSPEQAGLSVTDVDTRADIYGLGVLLFELLTGTTPFEKEKLFSAALDEACRIIRETDPPIPSTRLSTLGDRALTISKTRSTDPKQLSKLVRGDLDWIVAKSLAKDRNRRYESANGLSDDLERFLTNEPIEARPPSLGYRAATFWKKHRSGVSVVVAFVLLLVIGITALSWAYLKESATLRSLHNQLIERCVEQTLIGDEDSYRTSLANAKRAHVSRDWIDTLEGAWFLHQGQNEQANDKFEAALEVNRQNTSAWALQSIAIRHMDGRTAWETHMNQQAQFKVRSEFSEIDKLFLAYASFYINFNDCASQLEDCLARVSPGLSHEHYALQRWRKWQRQTANQKNSPK